MEYMKNKNMEYMKLKQYGVQGQQENMEYMESIGTRNT